jgi:hypothetical protein
MLESSRRNIYRLYQEVLDLHVQLKAERAYVHSSSASSSNTLSTSIYYATDSAATATMTAALLPIAVIVKCFVK